MTTTLRLAAAVLAAALLLPVARGAEPVPATPAAAATTDAKVSIPVGGMTCAQCVSSVTGKLQGVPGVKAVSVNLEKRRALVTYDATRVTTKTLVDAIREAGFEPGAPSAN